MDGRKYDDWVPQKTIGGYISVDGEIPSQHQDHLLDEKMKELDQQMETMYINQHLRIAAPNIIEALKKYREIRHKNLVKPGTGNILWNRSILAYTNVTEMNDSELQLLYQFIQAAIDNSHSELLFIVHDLVKQKNNEVALLITKSLAQDITNLLRKKFADQLGNQDWELAQQLIHQAITNTEIISATEKRLTAHNILQKIFALAYNKRYNNQINFRIGDVCTAEDLKHLIETACGPEISVPRFVHQRDFAKFWAPVTGWLYKLLPDGQRKDALIRDKWKIHLRSEEERLKQKLLSLINNLPDKRNLLDPKSSLDKINDIPFDQLNAHNHEQKFFDNAQVMNQYLAAIEALRTSIAVQKDPSSPPISIDQRWDELQDTYSEELTLCRNILAVFSILLNNKELLESVEPTITQMIFNVDNHDQFIDHLEKVLKILESDKIATLLGTDENKKNTVTKMVRKLNRYRQDKKEARDAALENRLETDTLEQLLNDV